MCEHKFSPALKEELPVELRRCMQICMAELSLVPLALKQISQKAAVAAGRAPPWSALRP